MQQVNNSPLKIDILGIDPGSTQSALVLWDGTKILYSGILPNEAARNYLMISNHVEAVAIEQIRGFGITAGNEIFDSVWWSGRFYDVAFSRGISRVMMIPRKTVVTHHCETSKAGDKDVRQAMIYRVGEQGTVKKQGPTYGIATHLWAALAVAVYAYDIERLGLQSRREAS